MAERWSVDKPWRILIAEGVYRTLYDHLFPGDNDEHGAVILAGISQTEHDVRLLTRKLYLAQDGHDYVPGVRGYRMLCSTFIRDHVLIARDERLIYVAIHNHFGADSVAFSNDDLRSHERGYPALLDVTRGMPVGALVFARQAIAGDIWVSKQIRVSLDSTIIVGRYRRLLTPKPRPTLFQVDSRYDRQTRLFSDRGQHILGKAKVAIVGLGGAGSLLAEFLGRLGVGHVILVDPERAEVNNLPRLVAASRRDACSWLMTPNRARWLQSLGRLVARRKVALARRNILRANPTARIETFATDFLEPHVSNRLKDCDYIFLAADSMRARLLFNAVVHQYLIPGVQVGVKVVIDKMAGTVHDIYAATRLVTPESGCLLCNKLINPTKLQDESTTAEELKGRGYVNDQDVVAPSVMALNALATAQAANDFMFYMTGLTTKNASHDYMRFRPTDREVSWDKPRKDSGCIECGLSSRSRFARGDAVRLPTKSY